MKPFLVFLLLLTTSFSFAFDPEKPLKITVAQDGSGEYKTIQEALNNVPKDSERTTIISIKNGMYFEKLEIPSSKKNIQLIGENKEKTIISYNDFSGKPLRPEDSKEGKTTYSTSTSYTLLIRADNCVLENLTIENTAGRVGQAVALHTKCDKLIVKNCRLLGNQDTVYLDRDGVRNYLENCYISGTTDFIFGATTAYFKKCTIESLQDSYITAASTVEGEKYGFVFVDCQLIAASDSVKKVYLGRPWRPFAQTVFINTKMGKHIIPAGWNPWIDKRFPDKDKTAYYAEYGSSGEGAKEISKRVSWSHQLKKEDLKKYDLDNVLNDWNPKKQK
ncbi:pectinesterase family protein [Flavobacterium agrisoli]|uniref:Pectinesterase n=1 Tax=Flavobacterium agrisoli TaxID=2793066 RepID=A0A934PLE3_9FLAO|nr:pectinesterase family protein [Flavobacterium agrisoli]MBK0369474.1 pectin esterase [Flavobacterium agrisoli]